MSTKVFAAVVAVIVGLLALPLIHQTLMSAPARPAAVVSRSAVVETATVEPVEQAPAQQAVLKHTYDSAAPQEAFVAHESAPEPVEELPPEPPSPPTMTRMLFERLNSGLTYEQCVQAIGCEGEYRGRHGVCDEYAWQLIDDPSNPVSSGEANLSFMNGILNGKGFSSNQGRAGSFEEIMAAAVPADRPAQPPYICRAVYDALRDGTTYEQCVQQLGVEGAYQGSRPMSGGTIGPNGAFVPSVAEVFVWHNPANQTTLVLSFRDGRLAAREISKSN